MRKDIERYVKNCDTCQRIKPTNHAPFGLLKPLQAPERPWSSISMDFITGLPESDGHDSIWVVVDRLTKMAYFTPCKETMKAPEFAKLFMNTIFPHHGLPKNIISDRGSLFTSQYWEELTKYLGIKRNLSTAFHPQTDGQTERVNAILEQYLRAYCNYQQDDWTELLPFAQFSYNDSHQESINATPFYANYGYHPEKESWIIKDASEGPANIKEYTDELRELHKSLSAEMAWSQHRQKEYADKKRTPDPNLLVGSKVWLLKRHIKTTRPSDKLDYKKLGPFSVLARIGSRAYKLDLPPSMKVHPTFHISLLQPYSNDPLPLQRKEPPPPIIIDDEKEYEIEAIIDSRLHYNKLQYKAKWTGYDPSHDQEWYPSDNFSNSPELIEEFHLKYPDKPRARPTLSQRQTRNFPTYQ